MLKLTLRQLFWWAAFFIVAAFAIFSSVRNYHLASENRTLQEHSTLFDSIYREQRSVIDSQRLGQSFLVDLALNPETDESSFKFLDEIATNSFTFIEIKPDTELSTAVYWFSDSLTASDYDWRTPRNPRSLCFLVNTNNHEIIDILEIVDSVPSFAETRGDNGNVVDTISWTGDDQSELSFQITATGFTKL